MNKFMKIALAVVLAAVMCVSAVADAAVPSIAQKAQPTLVDYTVYDADGNEVSVTGSIVVTPYLLRSNLSTEKIDDIEAAYEQLIGISDLTDLLSQVPDGTVALYLFDISAYDEAATYINAGGHAIVTLECDLGDAQTVVVLHNYEDDLWEIKDSTVISSTQVQVTIDSCSPYVVAVSDDSSVVIDEPVEGTVIDSGVDVSGTASSVSTMPYVVGGVACILIAGALLIVANRRKEK
ncbi:MAG: hypothetical protein LUE20_07310 [Oscillospiraceae bacterium]|nr:hypothetical protein [Oscillospiraceae bacterium]